MLSTYLQANPEMSHCQKIVDAGCSVESFTTFKNLKNFPKGSIRMVRAVVFWGGVAGAVYVPQGVTKSVTL